MRVPLKSSNDRHKFVLFIEAYNPILRLKKREKEVLLDYVEDYYNLHKSGTPETSIKDTLFSTKTRQRNRERIGMSEPSYNNHICQLKSKGILVEGQLMPLLTKALQTDDFEISYTIDNG